MMNSLVEDRRHAGAGWVRIAIIAAYASGVIAAMGLVFLVVFFSGFPGFGLLNDLAVILHYLLLLPIMILIHKMLGSTGEKMHILTRVVGLTGVIAVIVLQSLLVLGLMPFRRQIMLVIPAFLLCMVWFVLAERMGRSGSFLPKGITLSIMAGLVLGYPLWAFKLARNLETELEGGSL
ncbi:MAG: hypothetical protein PVI04_09205 [Anaerolineales bacterium]|jgi:hypothetical protein